MTRSAQRASAVMSVVGLSSLAMTGQIGVPWLVVGVAAVVARGVMARTRRPLVVPAVWANALIMAAMAFAVVDYLWLSPSLLHVGAHLLIALMITRLGHANAREYLQLVVIVFFLMVAAAGLSAHGALNGGFLVYLLVMVWVLVQYHLLAEAERARSEPTPPPSGLAAWTVAAALLALVTTGALFLLLPRMGLNLLSSTSENDVRLSGFSPQVRLGVIGPVKRDPTIVMRVSGAALGPGGQPLYLRGAVFDDFDGKNWTATAPSRKHVSSDGEGRFVVGSIGRNSESIAIQAEPLDTTVIFTPDRTTAVWGPFAAMLMDEDEIFNAPYPPGVRQRYEVWRRPPNGPPVTSRSTPERYLQLGEAARIARLAVQTTVGTDTPVGKAVAIERFLRTRYSYTLDVPGGDDRPLDTFLFERRSGYCEHFASAMALMLRTVGVPTRLVTGYLAQEWNPFGNYTIVRQGDAHAWVEAYLPESGWTRFDPTPPVPAADRPWTGSAEHYLDTLRTGWNRYVLDFGLRDQHAAIERAEAAWAGVRDRSSAAWSASVQRLLRVSDAIWIAGGCIAGALFTIGWIVLIRRGHAAVRLPPSGAPIVFYHQLLSTLERQGVSKPPTVTPAEFAEHHLAHAESSNAIRRVTKRYYDVRYGRRRLSEDERRQIDSDLALIEQRR
ncbi:MAG: transglutaminase TgpA family protein [Nitrospirota bacterium]